MVQKEWWPCLEVTEAVLPEWDRWLEEALANELAAVSTPQLRSGKNTASEHRFAIGTERHCQNVAKMAIRS